MDNINSLKDDIYKNENNNENDIEMKYTLITPNNSESFKAELQNNIEQYKYEFEKRLYNVLNKDIFSASFDPQKNIFDINGNFITYPEKKNNQKWKRKSKNNINFIKKNSFIYSSSILNLDLGNQDSNSSSLSKPKFKSENNISELLKKNMNNQNISKRKAFSYNNVSNLQNSSFNRTVENNSNNNDKKNLKYKSKDYQIRKTYEDLQRELENLENEFNNKSEESNEDKIKIDMRKKELHKNYKEYIKLNNNNNNTDNPNLRRYKNYVNDFEWVKQRHLDAINKQSIPKTTTEINEITERLYNPNNYPNVYKMKFNTGKSNEKLDSNTNYDKKISSSRKKLNTNKEKIYSQSEPILNSSNDDNIRARMIDQINNFSPLSPENFTMKSSKTKKNASLNTLNTNSSNKIYSINKNENNHLNNQKDKTSNESIKSTSNLKKSTTNINNNLKNNSIIENEFSYINNNSKNNISKGTINNSVESISTNKINNKVSFSTQEINKKDYKSNDYLKSSSKLNSMKNLSSSNKNISYKVSYNDLNRSTNSLSHKKRSNNESKSYTNLKSSSSSLNSLNRKNKSKKNLSLNKSVDSISRKTKKSFYDNTEKITESNPDIHNDDSFEIIEEDTGEQAALQFQHIMSVSSKSINNLNNYD